MSLVCPNAQRRPSGAMFLILLLLCFAASAGSAFAATADPAEVERWVQDLASGDAKVRREAAYQLNRLGAEARPAVPALIQALDDNEQQVWFMSVMTLAALGSEAKEATPKLIEGLAHRRRDMQIWYRSAYALGKIGPDAIPALLEALGHKEPLVRAGAAKALGWMGSQAHETIPNLKPLLNDSDSHVREQAAEALALIGRQSIPALLDALGSTHQTTRSAAAEAIAILGDAANDSAIALVAAYKAEADPEVRGKLIRALSKIGYPSDEFSPLLFDAFKDEHEPVRHAAINAILMLNSEATLPVLIEMLKGRSAEDRERAAYVLGRMGPKARSAVPDLIDGIQQFGENSALPLSAALVQIGTPAIPALMEQLQRQSVESMELGHWTVRCLASIGMAAVAPAIEALESPATSARLGALAVLAEIGKEARQAGPKILGLIDHPDERIRARALLCLKAIGHSGTNFESRVEQALNDPSSIVRVAAAQVLIGSGRSGKPLVPMLIEALKDRRSAVRQGSASALGGIGPDAASAAPHLIEALADSEPEVQLTIVRALAAFGSSSEPAVPALIGLAKNSNSELRTASVEALGSIGPAAKPALPAVLHALNDRTAEVRIAAIHALARIDPEQPSIPILIARLDDEVPAVRHAAAEELKRFGKAAAPAAPKLFAMLSQPGDASVALETLRQIEVGADSVPQLVEALTHPEFSVRIFACESLGRIGPNAKDAIPVLERRLEEESSGFIRRQVRMALDRIGRSDS